MPFIISDAEGKWGRVGNGLNTLNRFIKKFIQAELITYFSSLPRITDENHVFFDCLADSNGEPLRFDGPVWRCLQEGGHGFYTLAHGD